MKNNQPIYTPAGTDVTIRWKKMGWVAPSDDPVYQKKWADWKLLMARTIDDWQPEKKSKVRNA